MRCSAPGLGRGWPGCGCGRRRVGLAGRRRTVTPRAATQTPKPVLRSVPARSQTGPAPDAGVPAVSWKITARDSPSGIGTSCEVRLHSVTTTPTSGLHSCSLGSDQGRQRHAGLGSRASAHMKALGATSRVPRPEGMAGGPGLGAAAGSRARLVALDTTTATRTPPATCAPPRRSIRSGCGADDRAILIWPRIGGSRARPVPVVLTRRDDAARWTL